MFSPAKAQVNNLFLTVMSMSDEQAPELSVDLEELPGVFVLRLADRVVVLSRTGRLLKQTLRVVVRADEACQLLLTCLAPGAWSIRSQDGKVRFNTRVDASRNTAFFVVPGGEYTVQPEAIPGVSEFQAASDFMPTLYNLLRGQRPGSRSGAGAGR